MTQPATWLEESICREVFGILTHIANRPLSMGHDAPLRESRQRLREARRQLLGLQRQVLGDAPFALLGVMTRERYQMSSRSR